MNISEVRVPEQHLIVERLETVKEDLGFTLGPLYGKVLAYAQAHKLPVTGPAISRVLQFDDEAVVVEVGYPLAAAAEDHSGDVFYEYVPEMRVMRGDYYGHYDGLAAAHQKMQDTLNDREIILNEIVWEQYMVDASSEPDPAKWLTQIYYPFE